MTESIGAPVSAADVTARRPPTTDPSLQRRRHKALCLDRKADRSDCERRPEPISLSGIVPCRSIDVTKAGAVMTPDVNPASIAY